MSSGCRRLLSTTARLLAGPNKWSKTKNKIAVTAEKKKMEHSAYTGQIEAHCRMNGANLQANPQLADAVAAATEAGVPKDEIDYAILDGQYRLRSGARFEAMVLEILSPQKIAVIAEIETDHKNGLLDNMKHVEKNGGTVDSSTFWCSGLERTEWKHQGAHPGILEVLE